MGLQQDYEKSMELRLRAGELGYAALYGNIGHAYYHGEGVERDEKKAKHYYELAAIGGHVVARHNLGCDEGRAGNITRAVKHWMISAEAGDDDSLKAIRQCYMAGHATKDDFEKALRAHKEAKDEMKSEQREAAAAVPDAHPAARGQN
jgi:TPR repeat protein